MKRLLMFFGLIVLIFVFALPGFSKTIVIPGDASTIQDGISTADDFDTVYVTPGIYTENLILSGREVVILAAEGPLVTTLQPLDPDIPAVTIDNAPSMRGKDGRNFQPLFSGFTIDGGGLSHTIYIDGPTSVIIRDNIFCNNIPISVYDKAVIVCFGDSSSPLIERNTFYGNYGLTCIWIIEGSGRIVNNTFEANKSAFYCNSGLGEALNNIAVNNIGTAVDGSFGKIDYNDVWNNTTDYG